MAKEKQDVVLLQTTSPYDNGMKIVQEFTPEHAQNLLDYQQEKDVAYWEKAEDGAKVTKGHELKPSTTQSFVAKAYAEANPVVETEAKQTAKPATPAVVPSSNAA